MCRATAFIRSRYRHITAETADRSKGVVRAYRRPSARKPVLTAFFALVKWKRRPERTASRSNENQSNVGRLLQRRYNIGAAGGCPWEKPENAERGAAMLSHASGGQKRHMPAACVEQALLFAGSVQLCAAGFANAELRLKDDLLRLPVGVCGRIDEIEQHMCSDRAELLNGLPDGRKLRLGQHGDGGIGKAHDGDLLGNRDAEIPGRTERAEGHFVAGAAKRIRRIRPLQKRPRLLIAALDRVRRVQDPALVEGKILLKKARRQPPQ